MDDPQAQPSYLLNWLARIAGQPAAVLMNVLAVAALAPVKFGG